MGEPFTFEVAPDGFLGANGQLPMALGRLSRALDAAGDALAPGDVMFLAREHAGCCLRLAVIYERSTWPRLRLKRLSCVLDAGDRIASWAMSSPLHLARESTEVLKETARIRAQLRPIGLQPRADAT